MTYANPKERARFIAGLRELADFLSDHPEVPAPRSAYAMVFPPRASDAAMRGDIDVIAVLLDRSTRDDDGHYSTERTFGGVTYQAVAICAESHARYAAWDSYRNAVTPAETSEK